MKLIFLKIQFEIKNTIDSSDAKIVSDLFETRETLEKLPSDVTKKDMISTVNYDKNRRLTMKPNNRFKKSGDSKSSDEGSSNGESETKILSTYLFWIILICSRETRM